MSPNSLEAYTNTSSLSVCVWSLRMISEILHLFWVLLKIKEHIFDLYIEFCATSLTLSMVDHVEQVMDSMLLYITTQNNSCSPSTTRRHWAINAWSPFSDVKNVSDISTINIFVNHNSKRMSPLLCTRKKQVIVTVVSDNRRRSLCIVVFWRGTHKRKAYKLLITAQEDYEIGLCSIYWTGQYIAIRLAVFSWSKMVIVDCIHWIFVVVFLTNWWNKYYQFK